MAITAQALLQLPAKTALSPAGQIVWGPGDVQEPALVGVVTFTGDGSTTAAVVNFIDGTASIPFTPNVVRVTLVNGSGAGTDSAGVLRAEGSAASPRVSSITNVSATINYSTAIANTSTSVLLIELFK